MNAKHDQGHVVNSADTTRGADAVNEPTVVDDPTTIEGSSHSFHASQDSSIPQQIGKYRVIEQIGGGAQGNVYRALHPVLRRDVVIKWAVRDLSEDAQQRLMDEGRILSQFDDPALVRVFDVDFDGGRPFVVFEYVSGQSLSERFRRTKLSPRESAQILAEVARAVAKAHQQGVIHRDLKPANILIDDEGHPRLLDFGLALMSQSMTGEPPSDVGISGTLAYMAPEQARGDSSRTGPCTDVFGLGAVLYELLTGRPPFADVNQRATWERARTGNYTPIRDLNPRVSRSLERLCQRALVAEPDARTLTAEQFRQELIGYLQRPKRIIAGGAVAAVLVLVAVFVINLNRGQPTVTSTAVAAQNQHVASSSVAESAKEENRSPVSTTSTTAGEGVEQSPDSPPPPKKAVEPPAGWRVYHSERDGYTVWLPGTPVEQFPETESGGTMRKMSQAQLNDTISGLTFLVSCTEFPDIRFPDTDKALDVARDGCVNNGKFEMKLLNETPIKLGKAPGRDLRMSSPKMPGAILRVRLYLVGQKTYQLLVGGTEEASDGPAADLFFDSFRLDREL